MPIILKDVNDFTLPSIRKRNILLFDDCFSFYDSPVLSHPHVDGSRFTLFPGFTDVHVHLREPGFFYKETIRRGTEAAAHGGFTTVISMPNLDPVPDCAEHLARQLAIIAQDALVRVLPCGAITRGEMGQAPADMAALAPHVPGFSDDGRGVESESLMKQAMLTAKELDRPIISHCEDLALTNGGPIHDGLWAKAHGFVGNPSQSEWQPLKRDLALVKETGCAYHVCHVSSKESVSLIRQAKQAGLNVTAETAPHYLTLTDMDLEDSGRFKMNPPIRSAADRDALIEGLLDGTIDMIATDHAPHSEEEKTKGLSGSLNGIVGLETAFPVLYTKLVKPGILPLSLLIEKMSRAPNRRFRLTDATRQDYCLFRLDAPCQIDAQRFYSKGRSSPFDGWTVDALHQMTVMNNRIIAMHPTFQAYLEGQ